ncbi:COR domain-containing protein [Spirosoma arboris]|nr:COR domain-containing protein [Spirosoma arboris]
MSLIQLIDLQLHNNQIHDLIPLASLTKLKKLDVAQNQINVFPEFLLQLGIPIENSNGYSGNSCITIGDNPWKHPPLEILLKGNESVQAYFNSLENKQTKPLNEVKVVLIGEGAAGKTSLVSQLLGKDFNPHQSQTHGILIERGEYNCKGDRVQVNFWDFGGQEIMHATHQFFLTERSIYVLVLDSRKEDQTEYWLKHIDTFGKQSPVLVVINKIDENPGFDLNRPFLTEKYPAIANRFFRVSCKRGDGVPEFQDELRSVIQDMDIRKQPFSPDWLAVKQTLSTMKRDYITYNEFQQYCEADSVTDEAQQKTLLGFLNDLGIVFEHKRQATRHDTFIMNPQWLTQAVYRIINSPEVTDKNGFLEWDDLETILHKPEETAPDLAQRRKELKVSYPGAKFAFIVSMLEQFELCYKVGEDRWMIPDLLPVSRKDVSIDFTGAAHYLFAYDFLPNSVLPTLMVQLSRWIVQDLQWRTGVVLKDLSSESYAYIEADKEAKSIAIRVKSQGANFQRSFLNLIRQTLQEINAKLNIKIEEKVALPDMPNEYVAYQDLIDLLDMGEKQILIPKLKRRYTINDLLEGVDVTNRATNVGRSQTVNIFISYAHEDVQYKDELMKSLKPLIRQDKIQVWQDFEITAGQRWNDEIMGHLERAHIVIALMSPDFIDSDFCYSIELANALKAEARGEKTIIPIQVRPSAWEDLRPIGAIQGIPAKPVTKYSKRDDGWMEVYKGVGRALDRWQNRFNQT